MKRKIILFTLFLSPLLLQAQYSQSTGDSLARLSEIDHAQMKQQLDIEAPNRPGPSGDPNAPNSANMEESKVNNYTLPDPLVLNNGKHVKTAKEWWGKRRIEIVEDFDREIYGRLPDNIPSIVWHVIALKDTTIGSYPIKEKTLLGVVDNAAYPDIKVEIEMVLATPTNADGAVPVVTEFGFLRWPFGSPPVENKNQLMSATEPGWKEQLISRGWGYAIIKPSSIQADHGAGL